MKCQKCKTDNPETQDFCGKCGAKLVSPAASSTKSLETPREELTTGSTFAGRYKIVEELGKGGMGKVYRAVDNKLNEEVALKLIKPEIASDKKTIQRFSNELKLARKVSHRNVGRMYEFLEEKGTHFITMEYVPGQDLKGLIRQTGQLAMGTTISIAKQICEGLSEAHRLGVIHRDLKPNNIMIDKGGNARIMDFGIARTLSGKSMTRAGAMIGTPEYMSPEQAEAEEVDHRSDIYSLGVILYEMVTGRLPFEGETALSVAMKHKGEIPKDPKELNPQIPNDLSGLILKCLEKDKENRYQEAGDLLTELNNIEQGIPTTDRVVPRKKLTTSKEITVTLNFRRVLVPVVVIAAVVIVGLILWYRKPPEKPVVPPEKPANTISIVVFPFDNEGQEEDNYLASEIPVNIIELLTNIHRFSITPLQSSKHYKESGKSHQEIAEDGKDYILCGTIKRERITDPTSPVKISIELINAAEDKNELAKSYTDDMSEVLNVPSGVVDDIVKHFGIELLTEEQEALALRPTKSAEAWDFYRLGNYYYRQTANMDNISSAEEMYQKAVNFDPKFALAYCRLSMSHARMYWHYFDRNEERSILAKKAVDKAIQLNPDLAEAHIALGSYYYWCLLEYELALEQLAIAQKSQPNNSELLELIGYIQRRQGKFQEAMENLTKAFELDNKQAKTAEDLGDTCMLAFQYLDAERYFDHAISLSPKDPFYYTAKSWLYLVWKGSIDETRTVLEEGARKINPSVNYNDIFLNMSFWLNFYDKKYQEALEQLSSVTGKAFETQFHYTSIAQLYAAIYGLSGDPNMEREYYLKARDELREQIIQHPEDARFHSSLGIAYAGLRQKDEAIKAGTKAVELLPIDKDAWRGAYRIKDLAQIYTMTGDYENAIKQLEFLLSYSGDIISVPLLKINQPGTAYANAPVFRSLSRKGNHWKSANPAIPEIADAKEQLILQRNIIPENDISKVHGPSVIALKGQNIIAQGNTLGKETPEFFLAL